MWGPKIQDDGTAEGLRAPAQGCDSIFEERRRLTPLTRNEPPSVLTERSTMGGGLLMMGTPSMHQA
eukprot:scaffold226570_cov24-Tisochrysis_lutea.AAC.4